MSEGEERVERRRKKWCTAYQDHLCNPFASLFHLFFSFCGFPISTKVANLYTTKTLFQSSSIEFSSKSFSPCGSQDLILLLSSEFLCIHHILPSTYISQHQIPMSHFICTHDDKNIYLIARYLLLSSKSILTYLFGCQYKRKKEDRCMTCIVDMSNHLDKDIIS